MKPRFVFAASILLLTLRLASVQAVASDSTNCSQKPQPRQARPVNHHLPTADPYQTAYNYLVTFYPRWFTWEQGSGGPCNILVGPDRVSPIYQSVVAINVDTLYASAFIGVADEPVDHNHPQHGDIYSVLHLDQYGALVPNGMSGITTPGFYGIVGPNWNGTLPQGIVRVDVPYNFTELLFRADKYSPSGPGHDARGGDVSPPRGGARALRFPAAPRRGRYRDQAGTRRVRFSFQDFADGLISLDPLVFLRQMQEAVASPPLSHCPRASRCCRTPSTRCSAELS